MHIIQKYFKNLTENQYHQLSKLPNLYNYWNEKINVISRKDIKDIEIHHILHSLSIAKAIDFKDKTKILDIGTGGGFPGIPLAILFPKCNFILIDSIKKKIKVVNNIIDEIGLQNTIALDLRAENLNQKFDFIVSRAVTNMSKFKSYTKGKINKKQNNKLKNGILYLKGGNLDQELYNIKHKSYNISDFFNESFFDSKKIIYIEI
tara:strand:+ start:53663 stop:54277 length:615 start_codon:yes stop_codon:yes gene_type:complete